MESVGGLASAQAPRFALLRVRTPPHDARALNFRRAAFPLVLLLAAAVYVPALGNGFVWDDTALVLRDPLIRSWRLIPESFRHFLFLDATGSNFYRPLQRLTYTWDYALFHFAPWGYHLTNALLHAAAAGALFCLIRRAVTLHAPSRNAERIAFGTATIWAIHPLHSSAVIYVAGRADLLAAAWGFAGLALVLSDRWRSAGVCFFAAALSKESGAMFLVLAALIAMARNFRTPRQIAAPILILVTVLAASAALRFSAEKTAPPVLTPPAGLAERPALIARAWAEYAGLLATPVTLRMERDVRGPAGSVWQTAAGLLLLAGFGAWVRWAWRRDRLACAALAGFAVTYLPISNALPLNATVAEHWLYVPSAFLFFAAALTFGPRAPRWAAALLVVWAGCLAVRTISRAADWRDPRTFLFRTMDAGSASPRMGINLGALELAEGHPQLALAHYVKAIERAPDQPFALLGLGAAFTKLRDFSQARVALEKAAAIPLVRADALQMLAAVEYLEHGRDRVDLLREAASIEPRYWPARKRYITHLAERGEVGAAIGELRAVLETQPFRAESWKLLSDLLFKAGRPDLADQAHERAAQLDVHLRESGPGS